MRNSAAHCWTAVRRAVEESHRRELQVADQKSCDLGWGWDGKDEIRADDRDWMECVSLKWMLSVHTERRQYVDCNNERYVLNCIWKYDEQVRRQI